MPEESCRIFWAKCIYCGAVETSMHIRGIKEWTKDTDILVRCPSNVSKGTCPRCSKRDEINFAANFFQIATF